PERAERFSTGVILTTRCPSLPTRVMLDGPGACVSEGGLTCAAESRLIAHFGLRPGGSMDSTRTQDGLVAGFHGVRYQVADVARSMEFYTEHLGFSLGHQQPPAFAAVSIHHLTLLL